MLTIQLSHMYRENNITKGANVSLPVPITNSNT